MHNRNSPYEAWYNLTQGTPRPGVPPNNLQSSSPQNSVTPNHCSSPNGLQTNGYPTSPLPSTVLAPNVLPPNVLPANMPSNAYYMQQQNEAQMWHHHHHAMPSHTITPPTFHQVEYQDFGIHHQVANHLHNMQYGYLNEENHQIPSPPTTVCGSEMSSPGGTNGTTTPPTFTSQSTSRTPRPRQDYEWINKPSYQSQPNPGKTRTKDKYRVVYTDHQRVELEKEFYYSRYITIRRKAELAANLGLSERQVKIWFQNRRAKERKQVKKREELSHKENVTINQQQIISSPHIVGQGIIPVPIM